MTKSLLLHVSAETLDVNAGPARYALGMALALDARVHAPVFQLDVVSPHGFGRQFAAEDAVLTADYNALGLGKAATLTAAAHERGSPLVVETKRSVQFGVPNWLCDRAKLHDLTITGICPHGMLNERDLAEALLFRSGRPILAVPEAHDRHFSIERIAIAWDYSAPAARAVAESLFLLGQAKDVLVLIVGDDKRFGTALEAEDVVRSLADRGVPARLVERSRGDGAIGDVLEAIALEERADLLVMGAFGHSRFAEFILGGATRRVLDNAQLPIFLSH